VFVYEIQKTCSVQCLIHQISYRMR
jgi:hypothetical protein